MKNHDSNLACDWLKPFSGMIIIKIVAVIILTVDNIVPLGCYRKAKKHLKVKLLIKRLVFPELLQYMYHVHSFNFQ